MTRMASFETVTALVVDDNEHMLKIATVLLHAFGFGRILTAHSAKEGFETFCNTQVDLIVVDYLMPDINGLEFIELIRTDLSSTNKFVPIIMLSAHAELDFIRQARDIGATEFIRKPLSPKELLKKIITVIEKPRLFVKADGYFGPDRRRRNDPDYKGPEQRIALPEEDIVQISA